MPTKIDALPTEVHLDEVLFDGNKYEVIYGEDFTAADPKDPKAESKAWDRYKKAFTTAAAPRKLRARSRTLKGRYFLWVEPASTDGSTTQTPETDEA